MNMQFNITTDYAIRTVMYLAMRNTLTKAVEISTAMGIPRNYQLRITKPLVKKGILQCVQGVKGGFYLNKPSKNITLYDIVTAIEITSCITKCLENESYCGPFTTGKCPIRSFYKGLQTDIDEHLKKITIEQLVKKYTMEHDNYD
jgi:Rrf2 family protein